MFELIQEKFSDEYEVNLLDFYFDSIEEFLNFVYIGECGVLEKNVEEFLVIVDYFDIFSLKEICVEFLMVSFKLFNCLWIQIFVERYNYELLNEVVIEYICNYFLFIWKINEFLCLDFIELEEFICGKRFVIKIQKGEEEVFEGIRVWIRYDMENREYFFEDFFCYVCLLVMLI